MSFVIQINKAGEACPNVQCDICSEIIKESRNAIAVWNEESVAPETVIQPKIHCKECDATRRRKYRKWMQLDHYVAFLLNNLGLTGQKLLASKRSAAGQQRLGP
jgi:hypothetical protein